MLDRRRGSNRQSHSSDEERKSLGNKNGSNLEKEDINLIERLEIEKQLDSYLYQAQVL